MKNVVILATIDIPQAGPEVTLRRGTGNAGATLYSLFVGEKYLQDVPEDNDMEAVMYVLMRTRDFFMLINADQLRAIQSEEKQDEHHS